MSTKSKKEFAILAILVALLSLSIFSQMDRTARPTVPSASLGQRQSVDVSTSTNEVVQVDLLQHAVPELSGVKRNIFQFKSEVDSSQAVLPKFKPIQSQPSMATAALPDIHYLGFYFEKETGLKLASIENGGRIFVGKVGQILAGKYELLEIDAEHLILRVTDDGTVLRIPLGKGPPNVVNSAELNHQRSEH